MKSPKFHSLKTKEGLWIFYQGRNFFSPRLAKKTGATNSSAEESNGEILSPMPGKVFRLSVNLGDAVKKGQEIAVIEAMKMEHALTAPFDGVVKTLSVKLNQQVDLGQLVALVVA